MTRWRLTLEWDGAPFMGWQRQDHGPSVQAAVESAIERMTGEAATVHGAGRTDAGVHALAMAAHCDIGRAVGAERLRDGLNALVRPAPITVTEVCEVAGDWHARFSCIGRRYRYRILDRRPPPALDRGKLWHLPRGLDSDAMAEAAAFLVGRHDFTTFRSVHCQSESPVKTLDSLDIQRTGEEIHIAAAARSFLHHQVRSMVGCLALVGQGKWRPEQVREALDARERSALGLNAPPHGLYFVAAIYP